MKNFTRHLPIGFLFLVCFFSGSAAAWGDEETLQFGRLGKITLYRHSPQPTHVVLFVSGDGGWN